MAIISGGAQIGGGVQIQSWNPYFTLWSWGLNEYGQLGNGSTINRSSPGTLAGGGTNWQQISANGTSTNSGAIYGIKTDGTLWTWGYNNKGQLGTGTKTNRSSPGTTVNGGTTWAQVSTGSSLSAYVAAIKTDGTLWTCGYNASGQLGNGSTGNTGQTSFATVAGGGTTWSQVAIGMLHTAAVKTDGTLWVCGYGGNSQLGIGGAALTTTSRTSPVTTAGGGTTWASVACGDMQTAAIKTDGTLWTWGRNGQGQLGDGTTTERNSPVTVAGGGTTWASVSAGGDNGAAIKTDGTLWTWGRNANGQLGNGTTIVNTSGQSSPGTVSGNGTTWSSVSVGQGHTAAIKTNGTLWTWGSDTNGQLGDGGITDTSSPGTVAGGYTTWSSVTCGGSFIAALLNQ